MISSAIPSARNSWSRFSLMSLNGSTAMDFEGIDCVGRSRAASDDRVEAVDLCGVSTAPNQLLFAVSHPMAVTNIATGNAMYQSPAERRAFGTGIGTEEGATDAMP